MPRTADRQQREAEDAYERLLHYDDEVVEEAESLSETQSPIQPQLGPQELFLRCSADIAIYGGAAGGGKSYAGLLEPLYHINNPDFECIIFRRTFKQITAPGGLWDRSMDIYPQVGGKPNFSGMFWTFPSGAKVRFSHMQHEQDVLSWKGSEIPLIIFDELTDFSEYMFFYMLSRNRSLSGVKPYMRAMTNPDADSWVKHLLAPWVDPDYPETARKQGWNPEPAKSGEVRYFVREDGSIRWCEKGTPRSKSITFIAANIFDNKILMQVNPEYVDNLFALPELEKQRLLYGSWTVRPSGKKFKREWFKRVQYPPRDIVAMVRFWDLAATEVDEEGATKRGKDALKDGPDYTAGVKLALTRRNTFIVLDAVWFRLSPLKTQEMIAEIAAQDGVECPVWIEEEGGSGGKYTTTFYRHGALMAYDFHKLRQTNSKLARGNIFASHAEVGNVELLEGPWVEGWLNFMVGFPNPRIHDDPPDATFSAMIVLMQISGNIPVTASGTTPRAQLPVKLRDGEEMPPVQEPAEDDLLKETKLKRQAMLAHILQEVSQHATIGEKSDRGGGWI